MKNPSQLLALMSVLGLLEASSRQVPLGCLYNMLLHNCGIGSFLWMPHFKSQQLQEHIRWWTLRDNVMLGVRPTSAIGNCGDVHGCVAGGLGCTCHLSHGSGQLSAHEQPLCISVLEIKAVFMALQTFVAHLINKPVQVATNKKNWRHM